MGEKSSFLDRVSVLCHMGVKKTVFHEKFVEPGEIL